MKVRGNGKLKVRVVLTLLAGAFVDIVVTYAIIAVTGPWAHMPGMTGTARWWLAGGSVSVDAVACVIAWRRWNSKRRLVQADRSLRKIGPAGQIAVDILEQQRLERERAERQARKDRRRRRREG